MQEQVKKVTRKKEYLDSRSIDRICAPVKEDSLRYHFNKTGAKYPGERVCSEVRWRIFLRKMRDEQYFEECADPDVKVFPDFRF